jgi:hypothetical protein
MITADIRSAQSVSLRMQGVRLTCTKVSMSLHGRQGAPQGTVAKSDDTMASQTHGIRPQGSARRRHPSAAKFLGTGAVAVRSSVVLLSLRPDLRHDLGSRSAAVSAPRQPTVGGIAGRGRSGSAVWIRMLPSQS